MKENRNEHRKRIQALRERGNISANQSSLLTGVSQTCISRVEAEIATDIRVNNLLKVAMTLHMPVEAILNDEPLSSGPIFRHNPEVKALVTVFEKLGARDRKRILRSAQFLQADPRGEKESVR